MPLPASPSVSVLITDDETVRELNALTARDLDDLGINRSMITRLAHEAAWGEAK